MFLWKNSLTSNGYPRFREWIRLIVGPFKAHEYLESFWKKSGCSVFFLFSSTVSLQIICRWVLWKRKKEKIVVWVPDCFCKEVVDQLSCLPVAFTYYDTCGTYQPSKEFIKCENLEIVPDIFIAVDFFGIENNHEDVLAFCRKHKVFLVQDRTHCAVPDSGNVDIADFILYSPHKQFAIPDGAVLVASDRGPMAISMDDVSHISDIKQKIFLEEERFLKLKSQLNWIVKRMAQTLGFRRSLTRSEPSVTFNFSKISLPTTASLMSLKLLAFILRNSGHYVSRNRLELSQAWEFFVTNVFGKSLDRPFSNALPVYFYRHRFDTCENANTAVNQLRAQGIPAFFWPYLPENVVANHESYSKTVYATQSTVCFPIHASLRREDISRLLLPLISKNLQEWKVEAVGDELWTELFQLASKPNYIQTKGYGAARTKSGILTARR